MNRALLAAILVLSIATPAQAMTVVKSGSVITITAEEATTENHVGYFQSGGSGSWNGETEMDGYSNEEPLTATGTGCSMPMGYSVCELGDVSLVEVVLKGGDDFWDRTSPGEFDVAQHIVAGDGNDRIEDGVGADEIEGGAGNDEFRPRLADAGDVFSGGAGTDTVDYSSYSAAVQVTVGDSAGDGGAGEADDIRADVEIVVGTPLGDDLTVGVGPTTLRGGGGGDTLHARNGVADVLDCGEGTDEAVVDFADSVTGCETVDRAPEPDADGDGIADGADCDDGNAAVRPGATEIPGNGLDDDCAGGDAAPMIVEPPVIEAAIDARIRRGRFRRLAVIGPRGADVAVRCRGRRKRCPKGTLTLTIGERLRVAVPKRYRSKRIRKGATIEITVTAPGVLGQRFAYRLRQPKKPKLTKSVV